MVPRALNHMIAAAGLRAGLGHVHPHMLRHSCGFALANKGTDFRTIQDLLGHRDPKQHQPLHTHQRAAVRGVVGLKGSTPAEVIIQANVGDVPAVVELGLHGICEINAAEGCLWHRAVSPMAGSNPAQLSLKLTHRLFSTR